ncbi:MAG: hypothetical protein MMC23_001558 [Stictis urceolatum]|nr:hypothetical protein [Stictis urceolata]
MSVGFSPVVIGAVKEKYASLETGWLVMDIRQLDFADHSFEVAIDKGTMDAMLHRSLWDPLPEVRETVGKYVAEVSVVLSVVLHAMSDSLLKVDPVLKPGGR